MRGKSDHTRTRSLRASQTEAERILWQQLRARRLNGWKFRRQHRIGPYIVDFVCLPARLVLELDGSQHLQHVAYDSARTHYLARRGYAVQRFWNDDVFLRLNDVLNAIALALPSSHLASDG
ncbi:DUF559 domain-containing protein [Thermomonas sp.]|uniref:endonuclease domain-containing protein n=2 Tax=Thermomonas sp. TaxID=1971895 RepID=UPI002D0BD982|nr:DUF559 domain-containing protein [Thermomonas sp.]HRO64389.1 DUF559 domain-containing protein [Thermomonas sp.]